MKIQRKLQVLLYLSLLGCGFIFCWQNITEYFKGNTTYLDSNKHITLNDLPTLIVCIKQQQPPLGTWMANKLIYGKNFWMEAMVLQDPDMKNIPVILMENLSTDVSNIDPGFTEWSLKLHLSEMHMKFGETRKESDGHYYFRQCYKISPNWTGKKVSTLI